VPAGRYTPSRSCSKVHPPLPASPPDRGERDDTGPYPDGGQHWSRPGPNPPTTDTGPWLALSARVRPRGQGHPREIRYRRGRGSPSGFYEDSYDLPLLRRVLLDPLGPGGNRRVRTAARDVATDAELDPPVLEVAAGGVLLLDGIFLHRPQLRDVWDLSVWVEAPFEVTYARMAVRDGCPPDPDDPRNARYRLGQQLYLDACDPAARADLVLENADPANPVLTRAGGQGRSTARMPIAGSGS